MQLWLLAGVLILNVLISIWNCYAVGSAWKDVNALGGWFEKLLLWCGVVQSGVGFSMPILLGLTWAAVYFMTTGHPPMLSAAEASELVQGMLSLWYVAVIFPVLGSGFVIWGYSVREAYRRRDFSSFAIAGWNSYAQIHNTVSAVNHLGGAFGDVGKLFSSALGGRGDAKAKLAIIAILLVVLSLVAGFMIAFGLVRYFANKTESRIEQYGETVRA